MLVDISCKYLIYRISFILNLGFSNFELLGECSTAENMGVTTSRSESYIYHFNSTIIENKGSILIFSLCQWRVSFWFKNKRISVKIFLRLISLPCAHIWPLFLFNKTYKSSLYLLVTLEKSLDIIFALFFLLESSKLCPVCKPPFCLRGHTHFT